MLLVEVRNVGSAQLSQNRHRLSPSGRTQLLLNLSNLSREEFLAALSSLLAEEI